MISNLVKDGITCIIIAHRLRVIKNCDKVFVIEDGQINEFGSHKELMKKKGSYYFYWQEQTTDMN